PPLSGIAERPRRGRHVPRLRLLLRPFPPHHAGDPGACAVEPLRLAAPAVIHLPKNAESFHAAREAGFRQAGGTVGHGGVPRGLETVRPPMETDGSARSAHLRRDKLTWGDGSLIFPK